MIKDEIKSMLLDVKDVVEKCEIKNQQFIQLFQEKYNQVDEFVAKILVVGAFSAGKSALLNTLMGEEEILAEDITPETAVATELIYSENPFVTRILVSGESEQCGIDEIKNVSPDNCKKYIYHLPVPVLRELKDIVIVDMPGFSSGIKAHNKAIMQYMGDAAGYVFVVSADSGTLSEYAQIFLREISEYSPIIKFVMSKCDKNLPSINQKVAEELKKKIEMIMGRPVSITQTSIYSDNSQEVIKEIFTSMSLDELLFQKIGVELNAFLENSRDLVEEQLQNLVYNPYELEEKIRKNEQSLDLLNKELKKEIDRQHQYINTEGIDTILADVKKTLDYNLDELVYAASLGENRFNEVLSSLLRPVLNRSMNSIIEIHFSNLLAGLEKSMNKECNTNYELISDKLFRSLDALKNATQSSSNYLKSKGFRGMYKTLATVGAVVTHVVAPVLELIIIYLPEIFSLISKVFGESEESRIEKTLRGKIFPSIIIQLRPKIEEALAEVERNLIEELENQFSRKIGILNESIQNLKEEKERNKINISDKRQLLTNGVAKIESIICKVREMEKEVMKDVRK